MKPSVAWMWIVRVQDTADIALPKQWSDMCDYMVYQLERGGPFPTTQYLVGYISFKSVKTFAFVKRLVPSFHWYHTPVTPNESRRYVTRKHKRIAGPWEKLPDSDVLLIECFDKLNGRIIVILWRDWYINLWCVLV